MAYLNKFSSLAERASAQIAINLCQGNCFKEEALCLDKPIYSLYVTETPSPIFISDPKLLSIWTKIKEVDMKKKVHLGSNIVISFYEIFNENETHHWDSAIYKQCQSLTEWLPYSLRHGVSFWMSLIALEYLSFSRRQESLFGISRYFLMNILTREDWMEDCRLDEEKVANKFIQDDRLTVFQRFRIACVYCLYTKLPAIWMRLTLEEKQSLLGNTYSFPEKNPLVLLGARYMDDHQNETTIQPQNNVWTHAVQEVALEGNRVILELCWKRLKESVKRQLVFELAGLSVNQWQIIRTGWWKEKLVSNDRQEFRFNSVKYFALPSYYSELVRFFLSEMSEVEQLDFFKKAFQSKCGNYVLECLLDWPHHKDFSPMVHQLWGVIPKDKYGQCLLAVAKMYGHDCEKKHFSMLLHKENHHYDYRRLLWKLWEEIPEEYKRYLFSNQEPEVADSITDFKEELFYHLLNKSPFQEKDEVLFSQIWRDLLPEEKILLMNSKAGEVICSLCIVNEKWSFLNKLIKECLPEEEVPVFKEKFIFSSTGHMLCLYKLKTREKLLEDLIGVSLELYYEKLIFGCEFIDKQEYLNIFEPTFNENKFNEQYCAINLSFWTAGQFNLNFLIYAFCTLLSDCSWEQMSNLLAWSFNTEEKRNNFKKYLFCCKGTDVHYKLVFIMRQWEEVECFYRWFCLSPEEIINIKKEAIMTPKVIEDVYKALHRDTSAIAESLHWCSTDEDIVMSLKGKVEEHFKKISDKEEEKAKQSLDCLVKDLCCGFERKVDTENVLMENKREKRSLSIKDESSSPNKLFKHSF